MILNKIAMDLPGVQRGTSLKDFTTYKIGGPAKYFFIAKKKEDLVLAAQFAKKNKLPVFILGGGSNLLISDKGFKGLVIKVDISEVDFKGVKTVSGAGASLAGLAFGLADKGISGMEWAAGIPGTVGGAIYGNAQAFGTKICDSVESVEAFDMKTLSLKTFDNKQCKFALKNSIFKKNKNLVIILASLSFKEDDPEEIKKRIKEFLDYRKARHPIEFPSAGSTFVNPEIKIRNKKLLEKFPELKAYNEKGVIPSGYLIQKSGLTGQKIGNAQISEKHSNFIINLGGADAKSVLGLIKLAQQKVKKVFGITLEPEVQFVGFNKK